MPSKQPKKIKAPFTLLPYNISPKTFLLKHRLYDDITVASFVFYPPKFDLIRRPSLSDSITDKGLASNAAWSFPIPPARLLLLQRTSTDTTSPDLWEVPWGNSYSADRTVLHSVQRVMFEKTRLHLKCILEQIGIGEESVSSERVTIQLSFEMEIKEMADRGLGIGSIALSDIPVEVHANEHQDYVWATEEDIENDIFQLAVPQQKDVIFQAFCLREVTEDKVRAKAVRRSRARKRARYEVNERYYDTEEEEEEEEEDDDEEEEEEEDDDDDAEEEYEEEDASENDDGGILIPKPRQKKRGANYFREKLSSHDLI